MAGYSPDVIRDFAERFGSIAEAEEAARAVPGFGEEIRRIDEKIVWLTTAYVHPPPAMRDELEAERRGLIVEALKEDAELEGGALLPRDLVERAVQLHVGEGYGRRTLSQEPGLTEWYATQILRWYKRGKPQGLWLDESRLRWGTAITPVSLARKQPGAEPAPTYSHLRLPRI